MVTVPIELDRRAWVTQVMGLPVSVHLRGPGGPDDAVAARVEQVFAELRAIDATFSTYRPESEIGRLAGRAPDPATATADVREVRTGPGRPAWRVGVEDPDRAGRLLDVLDRRDGAVATSGWPGWTGTPRCWSRRPVGSGPP